MCAFYVTHSALCLAPFTGIFQCQHIPTSLTSTSCSIIMLCNCNYIKEHLGIITKTLNQTLVFRNFRALNISQGHIPRPITQDRTILICIRQTTQKFILPDLQQDYIRRCCFVLFFFFLWANLICDNIFLSFHIFIGQLCFSYMNILICSSTRFVATY